MDHWNLRARRAHFEGSPIPPRSLEPFPFLVPSAARSLFWRGAAAMFHRLMANLARSDPRLGPSPPPPPVPVHVLRDTPPSESPGRETSFIESVTNPNTIPGRRPASRQSPGTYQDRKVRATGYEAYGRALVKYADDPCCKANCVVTRLTAEQFMETRRNSYDRSSHGRSEWLDDKIHAARRVSPSGKITFSFTVGLTHPAEVCEVAFFEAADITGGSRSSAMAAARSGQDRRRDRLLHIQPMRLAPKKDEILYWLARYVEFRGHQMPHLDLYTTYIDKERRASMYSMFETYCDRQGIKENKGGDKYFTQLWNKHFINRDADDPRGQVDLELRVVFDHIVIPRVCMCPGEGGKLDPISQVRFLSDDQVGDGRAAFRPETGDRACPKEARRTSPPCRPPSCGIS